MILQQNDRRYKTSSSWFCVINSPLPQVCDLGKGLIESDNFDSDNMQQRMQQVRPQIYTFKRDFYLWGKIFSPNWIQYDK